MSNASEFSQLATSIEKCCVLNIGKQNVCWKIVHYLFFFD